jgi:hypothetical protein
MLIVADNFISDSLEALAQNCPMQDDHETEVDSNGG